LILLRKAYEWWGEALGDGRKPLPSNIAYVDIQDGQFIGCEPERKLVTWDEVLQERRERQIIELEHKRFSDKIEIKPCFIWVFDNGSIFPCGGWWCYILAHKNDWALNFRNERKDLQLKVMQMFPCGVFPLLENFENWMITFQKNYPVKRKRKREGMVKAWAKICNGRLLNIMKNASDEKT